MNKTILIVLAAALAAVPASAAFDARVRGTPANELNFTPSYADVTDAKPGEMLPLKQERFAAPTRFWIFIAKPDQKFAIAFKAVPVASEDTGVRSAGRATSMKSPPPPAKRKERVQLRNQLGEHRRRWYGPLEKGTTYDYIASTSGFWSLDITPEDGVAYVPVAANVPFAAEVPGGVRSLAEGRDWKVSPRPLADFEACAAKVKVEISLNILWLGDSLTDYDRGSNHVDTVAEYMEKTHPGQVRCWNYAKGGDCIRYIIQRMDGKGRGEWQARYDDLWSRSYDWAFVFLGHNDTKYDMKTHALFTPRAQQHEMYDELIRRLRAHGVTRIILLSSTSSDDATCLARAKFHYARAKEKGRETGVSRFGDPVEMEAFNAALREIAGRNRVEYCDIYEKMKALPYKAQMVRGSDGVHLTKRGHDYVALETLRYLAASPFDWPTKSPCGGVIDAALPTAPSLPREAVRNGAFELYKDGQPVDWPLAPGWKAARGLGLNGGGGLEFSCTEPLANPAEVVQLSHDVQPGKIYDFSAWVTSELDNGVEASVGISFLDERGNPVAGAFSGSAPNRQGWRRLSVRTQRLPANARTLKIFPHVGARGCGRVAFDDLSLKVVEVEPLTAFVTTAYRDELADEDGFIRFCGGADLADAGVTKDEVEAFFTWEPTPGGRLSRKCDSFDGTDAFLRVSAKDLPYGRLTLGYELKTKAGRLLGRRERPLNRVAKHTPRAVWLDPHGRVIRNGRPFFPIGIYDHTASSNVISQLKDSPFNSYFPYHGHTKPILDWCQACGLAVSVHAGGVRGMPEIADPEEALARDRTSDAAKLVAAVKDHPAVFAYLDNDEAPLAMMARLKTRYRMLREADPNHPAWAVLYQVHQIRPYCDTTDAIGSDPYPVSNGTLAWVTKSTRLCRDGTFGALSLWQTSQAFDWAAFKTKGTPDQDVSKYRAPTLAEMKNMNWQMIAGGAKALILYSHPSLVKMSWRDPYEKRWPEVKESVAEIAAVRDVLLSVGDAPAFRDVPETLAAKTWRKDGKTYALVVNASAKPLRTTLAGDFVTPSGRTRFGGGAVCAAGSLALDFGTEGYAFLEF